MHDSLALYQDLRRLFLAQGDYARAEEMAALREHEAGRLGYMEQRGKENSEKQPDPSPHHLQHITIG
jgi:hypothetical protein